MYNIIVQGMGVILVVSVLFVSTAASPRTGYHHTERKSLGKSIRESGKGLQDALWELRDARRREVPEERRTIFSPLERKEESPVHRRGLNRVSFKECNLEPGRRLDCGQYGIDEEGCYKRECCWGETTEPDVPWCYHSIPTIQSQCLLETSERQECGFYGIRKEQCLASDCCWQPSNNNGVPWCFEKLRVPIFEGECGVPAIHPSVMSRIVGGTEAKEHSWPWMVSLQIDGDHFCGGSLINNQWIVSAAHCEPAFNWGSRREIVLGMHSQTAGEDTKRTVKVDGIYSHEDYGESSGMDNDIMLVKLEEPVEFTDAISPVCLPEQDFEMKAGKRCYTTGWGNLRSGGDSPDLLQQVMIPVIDNSVCNNDRWYDGGIDDTMVCAGYEEGGRDSCQGDSGGPFVCYYDRKWMLNAIVSWGEGCASERKPGIYAKTSKFIKWVERTINKHL